MPDLKSLDSIYLVLGFIAPGLIIIYIRSQFITGRLTPHKEAYITYLTISVLYYALVLPIVGFLISSGSGYLRAVLWITTIFIGPGLVGLILGLNAYHGVGRRLLGSIGLPTIHVMPTAWDWKFSQAAEQWVLVTLKDGTQFAGFFGGQSFVSSEPTERDLYIERIYDIRSDNEWIDRGGKGLLVAQSEIRTVEFWPYIKGSNDDRD